MAADDDLAAEDDLAAKDDFSAREETRRKVMTWKGRANFLAMAELVLARSGPGNHLPLTGRD